MKQTSFLSPAQHEELVRAIAEVLEDADFNDDWAREPPDYRPLADKILHKMFSAGIAPTIPIWQPIETAPKEIKPTLKLMGMDAQGHVSSMFFGDGLWWRWLLDAWSAERFEPTHWMLIPECPRRVTT